jgi:23S rRNA (uracil1939-C5)-methyltransferase
VPFPSTFIAAHGWRCRVRLAVRATDAGAAIGLFQPGSHRLYALLDCPLHHPRLNETLQVLHKALRRSAVLPYKEVPIQKRRKSHAQQPESTGLLRYLQLTACATDDVTQEDPAAPVQLVCVVNCTPGDDGALQDLHRLLSGLFKTHGPASDSSLLHSIWLNFQTDPGNRILGPEWRLLHGPKWMWQRIAGTSIALSPGSFVQVRSLSCAAMCWDCHTLAMQQ